MNAAYPVRHADRQVSTGTVAKRVTCAARLPRNSPVSPTPPRLARILSRRTRNRADADDLVQDVFFRFARLRGQGALLERPQAYLRRIASNLLKDRAKSAARQSAALHVVADEETLPGLDPHRILESRDMLRRLEAAIMRLRPRTREVFVAHRVEGLTYAEIAERTGLSVKGVEKQMSKALMQLDRMLNRI